ncbi:MAG TPA: hypothetical protein VKR06_07225 [Ktedonosporobacter sp.]|nr:hypothetical protein [Ktedonosporobacter sp.]
MMESKKQPFPETATFACLIQDPEQQRQRGQEVAALFSGAQRIQELSDGYAFSFPADPSWASKLLEFILFEKECCPFFTFEMVFEQHHGPLELRLRGPEGVKEVLRNTAWLDGAVVE